MLQNRRPEERIHAREELRTEDLEIFGGFCSGCMRGHSWPVIAQADGRSGGGGARKWLRLRYCGSERVTRNRWIISSFPPACGRMELRIRCKEGHFECGLGIIE
jgi:hypothetical protein